jgi:DNA replication protein DnaC
MAAINRAGKTAAAENARSRAAVLALASRSYGTPPLFETMADLIFRSVTPIRHRRIPIQGDLSMNEALRKTLKQLRLSGLLESLEIRLQEAAGNGLSHGEFLELILQDELAVRSNRQLERRVRAAEFRERKSLEDFDWSFNPSIPRKQIYDLASCRFLREGRDVLWLGPPGVGKSFMVQAIGYQAIKAGYTVYYRSIFDLVRDFLHDEVLGQEDKMLKTYLKPELLIIDDMGMKQLPRRSGECLFEVVMRRYETRSTMMTRTDRLRVTHFGAK